MSKYEVNYRILGDSNRTVYTTIVEGTVENGVSILENATNNAMTERDIEYREDIEILDVQEIE
jgi:hypothetical protein